MRFEIFDTPEQASSAVADILADQLTLKPSSVLCLPTGGSPMRVYAQLRKLYEDGRVSFSQATIFNLDEYVGVGAEHPSSYAFYMQEALFDHVDCPDDRHHIPAGMASDPEAEADAYEKQIAQAGGIDVLFLGIGRNAHIAFNEPGSAHSSRTRVVNLAGDTISANARFFAKRADVPTTAITMGIGTILEARRIVLLATGADKAEALSKSLQLEPSEDRPASALQGHPNCDIIADSAAARLLVNRGAGAQHIISLYNKG